MGICDGVEVHVVLGCSNGSRLGMYAKCEALVFALEVVVLLNVENLR